MYVYRCSAGKGKDFHRTNRRKGKIGNRGRSNRKIISFSPLEEKQEQTRNIPLDPSIFQGSIESYLNYTTADKFCAPFKRKPLANSSSSAQWKNKTISGKIKQYLSSDRLPKSGGGTRQKNSSGMSVFSFFLTLSTKRSIFCPFNTSTLKKAHVIYISFWETLDRHQGVISNVSEEIIWWSSFARRDLWINSRSFN